MLAENVAEPLIWRRFGMTVCDHTTLDIKLLGGEFAWILLEPLGWTETCSPK